MLYVVMNDEQKTILGKWDAWYSKAQTEADELIKANNLVVVDTEITFFGNMIIYVEKEGK